MIASHMASTSIFANTIVPSGHAMPQELTPLRATSHARRTSPQGADRARHGIRLRHQPVVPVPGTRRSHWEGHRDARSSHSDAAPDQRRPPRQAHPCRPFRRLVSPCPGLGCGEPSRSNNWSVCSRSSPTLATRHGPGELTCCSPGVGGPPTASSRSLDAQSVQPLRSTAAWVPLLLGHGISHRRLKGIRGRIHLHAKSW